MDNRVLFSINITIQDEDINDLDRFDRVTGKRTYSGKEANAKIKYFGYSKQLIEKQKEYADLCDAFYFIPDVTVFDKFEKWIRPLCKNASVYDIIGFFKHFMMHQLSFKYNQICYFDLDVVPNTTINLFDHFDFSKIWVGDSTLKSMWGRMIEPKYFNGGSKDPTSKWIQAKTMAKLVGMTPLEHSFNTGIMFSNSSVIKRLNPFDQIEKTFVLIEKSKLENIHPNYIRGFEYDNEVFFSHLINTKQIEYRLLDRDWHCTSIVARRIKTAKLIHVMNKKFEDIL